MQQSDASPPAFPPSDLQRVDLVLLLEAAPGPPCPVLSRDAAQQVFHDVAADLATSLGSLAHLQLMGLGTLFDPADLLRPGLPVHQALFGLVEGACRQGPFQPGLVALGNDQGRYPVAALNPTPRPVTGPLYALPMILVGPSEQLLPARAEAESRLMRMATVSASVREAIAGFTNLAIDNASYATLTDLTALLKNSFDALDLEPVWSVLVQALYRAEQPARFESDSGLTVDWTMDEAQLHFLTLDAWIHRQGASDASTALSGYRRWMTAYRRAFAALEAHQVPVSLAIGSQGEQDLQGAVLSERLPAPAQPTLTAYLHVDEEIGVLAASRLLEGPEPALEHRYPLTREAVAVVAAGIDDQGPVTIGQGTPALTLPLRPAH